MAKKARSEDVDRISNLPDAILSHILSVLSTKEAVRTSILSTRWRYLFALVTNLDFELDGDLLPLCEKSSAAIQSFMNFVDRVLFLHNRTSIERFRLKCGRAVDSSHVYGWLSAAIWCGVQHLDLNIISLNFTTVPCVLFICKALETLKLNITYASNVLDNVCFPNLRTLHLKSIMDLTDDSVKRLLSGCISLEDMAMEDCSFNNISNLTISHHLLKRLTVVRSRNCFSNFLLAIDAPMLVYFKYNGIRGAEGYSFQNLQSLVSADIDFHVLRSHILYDATSLFKGIHNVQSLNRSSTSLKSTDYIVYHYHSFFQAVYHFLHFKKMVKLKLCYDIHGSIHRYYSDRKGLADLLLSNLPQLEKLAFHQEVFNDLPEKAPFCLFFKLKVIEISEAWRDCIEKAKYFLENAGVLEKLTVRTESILAEKIKLKISEELIEELLALPRKSKQVCIKVV